MTFDEAIEAVSTSTDMKWVWCPLVYPSLPGKGCCMEFKMDASARERVDIYAVPGIPQMELRGHPGNSRRGLLGLLLFVLFFASRVIAQDVEISFEEFKDSIKFPLVYEEDGKYLSVSISAFRENYVFTVDFVGKQLQKYEYVGLDPEVPRMQWNVYTVEYEGAAPPDSTAFCGKIPEISEYVYSVEEGLMIMTRIDPETDKFYLGNYSIPGKNVSTIKIVRRFNEYAYVEKVYSHEIPLPQIAIEARYVWRDRILIKRLFDYRNHE